MKTDRHQKVVGIIRELIAQYVQQEANTDPLITITGATIAPDYRRVTILFTTIPDDREKDAEVFLKRHATDMRQFLKRKAHLKIIPHLDFQLDVGERHRQHMDEVVRSLE